MEVGKFTPRFKRGRFAPSTTGRVHPGTLLAGLLCWLDLRSCGGEVVLRLEDLDRERTKPGYVDAMERDLEWFGLDWDSRSLQSENGARYETSLQGLIEQGRVYPCDCSRARIRAVGCRAPDGSYRYPGTCRERSISSAEWREIDRPLRLRLDPFEISLRDESGLDLSGDAAMLFGDPILRRRDGTYAYHFASVLDDSEITVDRVVRGRDLAPSTVLQVALQRELLLKTPSYRHHCLFLERTGAKLSKFHGAVDVDALREKYDATELCGMLASFVGLVPVGTVCRPVDLVDDFDWNRVRNDDVELGWADSEGLTLRPG
jgi:glutamyl-tRNA synthetase/glutamyl-Q tRNA(Asp) synthetase